MKVLSSAMLLVLTLAGSAAAQGTVFVVRHAERADMGASGQSMAADPDLSAAGRARAESLASMLKDAGITAVFTSEFKRTQQTAAPLAGALGLQPTAIPQKEMEKLIQALKAASGNVLVVGHSNTVPAIIKGLGVETSLTLGDGDYDNLFIVTTGPAPRVIRLHFR